MTMDPLFFLNWDAHQQKICHGFASLQQREEFVDMTLAAEGRFIKVHQNIIAVASPYLKNLLKSIPCPHPVILLNDINYATLNLVLDYIYKGKANIPSLQVNSFLKAAKSLQIVGFEVMELDSNLNQSNFDVNPIEDNCLEEGCVGADENVAQMSKEVNYFENTNNPVKKNQIFIERPKILSTISNKTSQMMENVTMDGMENETEIIPYEINEKKNMNTPLITSNQVIANQLYENVEHPQLFSENIILSNETGQIMENIPMDLTENETHPLNFQFISMKNVKIPITISDQTHENQFMKEVKHPQILSNTIRTNQTSQFMENITMEHATNETEPQNFNFIANENMANPENTSKTIVDFEEAISNINKTEKEMNKDNSTNLLNSKDMPFINPDTSRVFSDDITVTSDAAHKIDREQLPYENTSLITINCQTAGPSNLQKQGKLLTNCVRLRRPTTKGKQLKAILDKKIQEKKKKYNRERKIRHWNRIGGQETVDEDVTKDLSLQDVPKYTLSNKGCLQLISDGFIYYAHHVSGEGLKRRWRCIEYRRQKCPAYLDAFKDVIVARKNKHVHLFHDLKIKQKEKKNVIFDSLEDAIKGAAEICENVNNDLLIDDDD